MKVELTDFNSLETVDIPDSADALDTLKIMASTFNLSIEEVDGIRVVGECENCEGLVMEGTRFTLTPDGRKICHRCRD